MSIRTRNNTTSHLGLNENLNAEWQELLGEEIEAGDSSTMEKRDNVVDMGINMGMGIDITPSRGSIHVEFTAPHKYAGKKARLGGDMCVGSYGKKDSYYMYTETADWREPAADELGSYVVPVEMEPDVFQEVLQDVQRAIIEQGLRITWDDRPDVEWNGKEYVWDGDTSKDVSRDVAG